MLFLFRMNDVPDFRENKICEMHHKDFSSIEAILCREMYRKINILSISI